jgi:hypothetical protein
MKLFANKVLFMGLLLTVTCLSFPALMLGNEAVSIELRLPKDTLALAEATMLTVAVTNHSNTELLLDNRYLFGATESLYHFKLVMVSPEGEEWEYKGGRRIKTTYLSTSKLYFLLPPEQRVEEKMYLWATTFVPGKYRQSLEKLTPGNYKLFATYHVPVQDGMDELIFYSDTVEFVYLPLNSTDENSKVALREMNALSESFLGMFASVKDEGRLQTIVNTNTPYSEAAHSIVLALILASIDEDPYDRLITAKMDFNKLYPNSAFESIILELQKDHAEMTGRISQADSLAQHLEDIYPAGKHVLFSQNKITVVTAKEVVERRMEQ